MIAHPDKPVLVVAAHPDDEVLGCGGTIARLTEQGTEVHIAILGEGATSRYDKRDQADPAEVAVLSDHARQVADLLGVAQLHRFDLPDNRFDTVPLLEVIKRLEKLIDAIQPATLFTQHGGDVNIDHVVTFRAALTATRPQAAMPVREVLAYEVPSSTEWAFQQFEPPFKPNVFIDISSTLETKLQAMRLYESEARAWPHPRSDRALTAQAENWGRTVSVDAAEAFQLVRKIG